MANKLQSTPAFPSPSADWQTTFSALTRTLFDMLSKDFTRTNLALPSDGTETMTAPLPLASYLKTALPDATKYEGGIIYVSNETGGATLAFSDGTNWRRVQDRAVVS